MSVPVFCITSANSTVLAETPNTIDRHVAT
jgi:hypothetical protein